MATLLRLALLACLALAACGDSSDPVDVGGAEDTGEVLVDGSPDPLGAPWVLTGPAGYRHVGAGDATIADLAPGEYRLAWGEVDGWSTPFPQTKVLEAGLAIVFGGEYVNDVGAGFVVLAVDPGGLDAPWLIDGPQDYEASGEGDILLDGVPPGEYGCTWVRLPGWTPPPPEVQTLPPSGVITFVGRYVEESVGKGGGE